jgi:hypothetical protein
MRITNIRSKSLSTRASKRTDLYPMRPTPLMTNRWEGLVPVAAGTNIVHYRYKFDFDYNAMGKPKQDSAMSPEYTLRILDK